ISTYIINAQPFRNIAQGWRFNQIIVIILLHWYNYICKDGGNVMKKRLISVFLCAIIALSLVGCGFIDGFKEGFKEGFNESEQEKSESN
ncbi:MAG TPA: hypothetical protein DCW51_14910, partial [Clostridium sp.]|nr:hypothetical protein [Clostridium sp.]